MMYLVLLWLGFSGILLLQLLLCFRGREKLLKLLPLLILVFLFGVCMAVYQIASGMGEAGNKVAFQLDWYNVLVCFWGLADMLAWVLFLIIKGAQKLSNFFVM